MNRIMPAALALAAIAPTAAGAAERRYSVTSFDRIQVEGPYQVVVATGRAGFATATGSSNKALEGVSVEVQARVLKIRPNRSGWGGYPGESAGTVSIAVGTHELRAASVAGSGSISIDKAKAMKFDAQVAGSGRIGIGDVQADVLTLSVAGAGRIAAAGKAKTLRATVQGSGDLDAGKLDVEDAEIGADTAGSVAVAVRRAAKVTSTGAGDTTIIGSPACTLDVRGAGRVACAK